jgi:uncharacterized protein (DUF58 family)
MARDFNPLDPATVAAVGDLRLRARLVVEGLLAGLHRSPLRGVAQEFVEHRPYQPGDEPRLVDWRVWAKTDRLYVKNFEQEADLRCWLVVDTSASKGYAGERSRGVTKLDYAVSLAAALAYITVRQGDGLALAGFGEGIAPYLPPRRGPLQLSVVLAALGELRTGGLTDFAALARELAARTTRRGLFVVLSDLWGDPPVLGTSLAALAARKHELICLHVLDPDEVEPDFKGSLLLEDVEDSSRLPVDGEALALRYRQRAREHFSELSARLRSAGIDYLRLTTDEPFTGPLRRFLSRRARLVAAATQRTVRR